MNSVKKVFFKRRQREIVLYLSLDREEKNTPLVTKKKRREKPVFTDYTLLGINCGLAPPRVKFWLLP